MRKRELFISIIFVISIFCFNVKSFAETETSLEILKNSNKDIIENIIFGETNNYSTSLYKSLSEYYKENNPSILEDYILNILESNSESLKKIYDNSFEENEKKSMEFMLNLVNLVQNNESNLNDSQLEFFIPQIITDETGENIYSVKGFVQKSEDEGSILHLRGNVVKSAYENYPGLFGVKDFTIDKYNPTTNSFYTSSTAAFNTWIGAADNGLKIYIGENSLTTEGICQFGFIYGNSTNLPLSFSQDINYKYFSNEDIDIPVSSINFESNSISMQKGETKNLNPKIVPENATIKNVNFYSENPSIVSVNADGSVEAISRGITDVIVETQDNGYKAICSIDVQ